MAVCFGCGLAVDRCTRCGC